MTDIYFDIETIPDYNKEGMWGGDVRSPAFDVDFTLGQSVTAIKDSLKFITSDGLQELLKAEIATKNRSSAVSAIESELRRINEPVKTASLTPEYNRVVCIGYAVGDGEVQTLMSDGTDEKEREIISEFWGVVGRNNRLVGYNVTNFDIRVLAVRSALLGVSLNGVFIPELLNRYSRSVVDLMNARFPFMKAMKLKDLVVASGISPLVKDVDGSNVLDLFNTNKERLSDYCKSDVHVTRELARVYKGYLYA